MSTLTYLFDPLCGWCYGAAPALRALIARGRQVALMPSGLFIQSGRTTEPAFATYAWNADQRIAKLTGQACSEAYRADVLGRAEGPFNSGPATLALTAVWRQDPTREAAALAAIRSARWVGGRDICDAAVPADIVGLPAPDPTLIEVMQQRTAAAQSLMRLHRLDGIPALLVGAERALPNGLLFGPRAALLAGVA